MTFGASLVVLVLLSTFVVCLGVIIYGICLFFGD